MTASLRLELSAPQPDEEGTVVVRLLVVNDSTEDAQVDRSLLWGPHPESGAPGMLAGEPGGDKKSATVLLHPGGVVGRERRYQYGPGESVTFHGYLLKKATDTLLPQGPGDADALEAAATPLEVRFD